MTVPESRSFTDTPQFKIMRTVVGAANPFVSDSLPQGSPGRWPGT